MRMESLISWSRKSSIRSGPMVVLVLVLKSRRKGKKGEMSIKYLKNFINRD